MARVSDPRTSDSAGSAGGARVRSKKGAAPAAEQPASTPVLDALPIPGAATTDTAPEAEAIPGAAEGASAPAAPGPEAPEASVTREAANDGAADAGADLAATPAALPDEGAAAGATGVGATEPAAPLGALSTESAVQAAIDGIRADTADVETSGLAQDIGEIRLKVTAKVTKSCARLLWLEGQERTFVSTDLDPGQLFELDEDPDFELDFFKP